MKKARSNAYCKCGFGQFQEVFKDVDISQVRAGDPRLSTVVQKTISACASKVSEDQIKENFTEACVDGDERKRNYCSCAWSAMRKNLEAVEFIALDLDTPRLVTAKKAIAGACKGKFPIEVAKADFIKGCTKEDAAREAHCTCIWNKIKASFTVEELYAGTADPAKVKGLSECENQPRAP